MALHDRLTSDRRILALGASAGVIVLAITSLALLFVFAGGSCGCTDPPPKFVFEENVTDDGTTVTIANNRGDFRSATLSVEVNGTTTAWPEHGTVSGQLGNDSAVIDGDVYTVADVEQGDEIQVLWTPRSDTESQVMARYTVGTNRTS